MIQLFVEWGRELLREGDLVASGKPLIVTKEPLVDADSSCCLDS